MSMARVRSKIALEHGIDSMRADGYLRLWTFTLPIVLSIPDACLRWSILLRELEKQVLFSGIRVFELHETHGLHVHVVVNKYYSIDRLRWIAEKCGWGRTHVQRCNREPYYVAKYVGQAHREESFRGRRLWAAFGMCKLICSRCKDIEVRSGLGDCFKAVELEPWLIDRRKLGGRLYGSDYLRYIRCAYVNLGQWFSQGDPAGKEFSPAGGGVMALAVLTLSE